MAKVKVNINNRTFQITCEDGEEAKLKELASFFSRHVDQLQGRFGYIGDARIYIMAGLLIADKLSDALSQIEEIQNDVQKLRKDINFDQDNIKQLQDIINKGLDKIEDRHHSLSRSLH